MDETRFTRLDSERLILRRFGDSDLAPILSYRNDPEVARYQSWDSCSEEEALALIGEMKSAEPGSPGEWFQFAVELKQTGEFVGDLAMKVDASEHYQAEIGYTFSREHQGKGYATEAVCRLLDYAFEDQDLHRIVAIVDCENERSIALLERLGMRREGHSLQSFPAGEGWVDEYYYAVLEDEWNAGLKENAARDLRIISEPHASSEDATFIRESLALYNVAVTGDSYYSPLAIFLRDGREAILGGVLGDIWGGWLDLSFLWVAEPVRGHGYGTRLLEAAEQEARAQGCHGVFLTTFSFQARPFYERSGYEVVADIPDYPRGHSYHVLKKTLA
jgi:RimJ/RimL family protein N-acetyltransferase